MDRRFPALLIALAASGCSAPVGPTPSLSPRTAEAIDPRVPLPTEPPMLAPGAGLLARLGVLIDEARRGDAAFGVAAAEAERLAASAGPAQSESWIAAQQAVSAAVAARGPTTRALGDVDAIAAEALALRGGMSTGDLAAVGRAAAEVAEIDRRQAARLEALQARLGS